MKNPLRQAARNMMDQGAGTLTRLAAEAMHLRMIERVQVGGTPNPR
jgi:hypothetical protein